MYRLCTFRASFALMFLAAIPVAGPSAVLHVPGDFDAIQAGIDAAAYGDTVLVACGTYEEHDIVMKDGVVLSGETGLPGCVTIDAGRQGRVLLCQDLGRATIMKGIDLTGGYAYGSGIDFLGGGLLCSSASPTVIRCTFTGNDGDFGGAVACWEDSSPIIDRCTFSGNTSTFGGGVYCWRSSPEIHRSTFTRNAAHDGGAIYAEFFSSPDIAGCTISDNAAAHAGGGMYFLSASTPTVRNTIIAFSTEGEAVYCTDANSVPTLNCCNVFGNEGGDWDECIAGQLGSDGNIAEDPAFCDRESDWYSLRDDSPCAPGPECDLIGAWPIDCIDRIPVAETSWGSIKAGYR